MAGRVLLNKSEHCLTGVWNVTIVSLEFQHTPSQSITLRHTEGQGRRCWAEERLVGRRDVVSDCAESGRRADQPGHPVKHGRDQTEQTFRYCHHPDSLMSGDTPTACHCSPGLCWSHAASLVPCHRTPLFFVTTVFHYPTRRLNQPYPVTHGSNWAFGR